MKTQKEYCMELLIGGDDEHNKTSQLEDDG